MVKRASRAYLEEIANRAHEMPEVYVEAESVEEGYEIARFKYHDIGYNIVHAIRCLNASRIKKVE